MSEDENRHEDSTEQPDRPEEEEKPRRDPGEEAGMDDRAAEFVFRIFREQDAEAGPSAVVDQWTKFLSACNTGWTRSAAGNAENPDPAIRIMKAGMIHTGMGLRTHDIWLDVQNEYTAERGAYLNGFSGRLNNPFFGFDAEEHPVLLAGPIPHGDEPLGEILRQADDRMYSFRWLDGTNFRAVPCIDRNGSLLICDLKNMDMIDIEKTNAALITAGSPAG